MSKVYRDEELIPRQAQCDGCAQTEKWVAEFALACCCHVCGRLHEPRRMGVTGLRQNVFAELDNLARWTPDIVGKALPLEPPLILADIHASGTTGRAYPAEQDPDAEETGGIDGLTIHVSGNRNVVTRPGRPQHVDDAAEQFARAVTTLRRLDALAATPDGARHVAVLLFAGWHYGEAGRAFWDRIDDDAYVHGEENSAAYYAEIGQSPASPLGFHWRIGWVCAHQATRLGWLAEEYLTMAWAAARTLGKERLEDAIAAFAEIPADPPRGVAPRLSLQVASFAIQAVERQVDGEILCELTPRVWKRREDHRASLS